MTTTTHPARGTLQNNFDQRDYLLHITNGSERLLLSLSPNPRDMFSREDVASASVDPATARAIAADLIARADRIDARRPLLDLLAELDENAVAWRWDDDREGIIVNDEIYPDMAYGAERLTDLIGRPGLTVEAVSAHAVKVSLPEKS